MTSEACASCGARNWTIYRQGRHLTIRCGDCDTLAWDARTLDEHDRARLGRILP